MKKKTDTSSIAKSEAAAGAAVDACYQSAEANSPVTLKQVTKLFAESIVREVYDTGGAARYALCSKAKLEQMRVQGGGPRYVKLGRLVRYRRVALDEWLLENERRNSSDGLR